MTKKCKGIVSLKTNFENLVEREEKAKDKWLKSGLWNWVVIVKFKSEKKLRNGEILLDSWHWLVYRDKVFNWRRKVERVINKRLLIRSMAKIFDNIFVIPKLLWGLMMTCQLRLQDERSKRYAGRWSFALKKG
jgi:hypothetical protein